MEQGKPDLPPSYEEAIASGPPPHIRPSAPELPQPAAVYPPQPQPQPQQVTQFVPLQRPATNADTDDEETQGDSRDPVAQQRKKKLLIIISVVVLFIILIIVIFSEAID